MFPRHIQASIDTALADTPAVLVVGARQTGKTTLVQAVAASRPGSTYVTLDDLPALEAATTDPIGFVGGLAGMAVIDEIQKAPVLLPTIKASVDRDRRAGRFLMTGSADVLTLPRVSESLAGRMEVATLWPLSQGELSGRREGFVDAVLRGETPGAGGGVDPIPLLVRGGYPEAHARVRADRRRAFFDAYVTTLLTRDVRDLVAIEDPGALRRLLQLAAARTASLLSKGPVREFSPWVVTFSDMTHGLHLPPPNARTPFPGPEALGMRLVIVSGRNANRARETRYPNPSHGTSWKTRMR